MTEKQKEAFRELRAWCEKHDVRIEANASCEVVFVFPYGYFPTGNFNASSESVCKKDLKESFL